MLYLQVLLLISSSLTFVISEETYQEAPCADKFGQCQEKNSRKCKGGHFEEDLCPTQSDDVECCIQDDLFGDKNRNVPFQSTKCLIQGGRCQDIKSDPCTNGNIDYASCLGQGVDIKCCRKNFYIDASRPYQETLCMVEGGDCRHISNGPKCDDGQWRYGKCIRQPLVECCVPKNAPLASLVELRKESPFQENECTRLGGKCDRYVTGLEQCSNGAWQFGMCIMQPGVQCCVPKYGVNASLPFLETECAQVNGRCQTTRTPCAGTWQNKCPAQVAQGVLCCTGVGSGGGSSGSGVCRPEPLSKLQQYFRDLFDPRENCSTSTFDQRNWYEGRRGSTCVGITPKLGWENRRDFSSCRSGRRRSGNDDQPADFVGDCFERDPKGFASDAHRLYEAKYQKDCMAMKMPAYYSCIDALVSAGPENAEKIIDAALESTGNPLRNNRELAFAINREQMKWIESSELKGELSYSTALKMRNRVNERDSFVEGYMKGAC